jgi:hypothetical protein
MHKNAPVTEERGLFYLKCSRKGGRCSELSWGEEVRETGGRSISQHVPDVRSCVPLYADNALRERHPLYKGFVILLRAVQSP